MERLDFKTFIERLELQKRINPPTVHYVETVDYFKLFFKNYEYWEYYTIVLKSNIIDFGIAHNVGSSESLDDFRMEYLNNCLKVELDDDEYVNALVDDEEIVTEQVVHKTDIEKSFDDILDAGSDVVDESKDYATYLEDRVKKWESKVIKAIEYIDVEKSYDYNKKTFGEFLSSLMNIVNNKNFINRIIRFIKNDINTAIETVENELGIQIGFTSKFDDLLDKFTIQQFDGYSINGKRWPGIKGATKQTQFEILKSIEENLSAGNSRSDMIKDVQSIFQGSTLNQATRIARTETTRFLAEAKLASYKESGVEGNKSPSAANDSRTSDLCRRLDKKYRNKGVPLDSVYVDDVTGLSFQHPFHHPNCRCTLEFIPSKKA